MTTHDGDSDFAPLFRITRVRLKIPFHRISAILMFELRYFLQNTVEQNQIDCLDRLGTRDSENFLAPNRTSSSFS